MKNICSGLLIITLSLGQVCSAYDAEGSYPKNEIITEGKISSQKKNGNYLQELNKDSNKSKEEKSQETTNINADLTVPSIALSAAILGATGIHEYAELKKPNIFKQFYSATFGGIWNLAKDGGSWLVENYPIAKNWISKKFGATQNWTSEKYNEGKIWFEEADTPEKVVAGVGSVATLMTLFVSMYFCCCRCCGCCKVSATAGSGT